jgi:hypothetical protein
MKRHDTMYVKTNLQTIVRLKAKRYDLEKHDIMILAGNSALALGFLAQTFETVLGYMGKR